MFGSPFRAAKHMLLPLAAARPCSSAPSTRFSTYARPAVPTHPPSTISPRLILGVPVHIKSSSLLRPFCSKQRALAATTERDAISMSTSNALQQPGTPSSNGISQRLWIDSQQEVQRSLFHPFVLGIARGDLPRSAFKHYIGQDAYFLEAFARSYALAAAQSHVHPDHVTDSLVGYMKGVFEELTLHKAYAKENGVDLSQCSPSDATTAYCDFVLGVANSERGVAAILAAMAPCMRLYAFLGAQLAAKVPSATSPDNPYSEWVKTYSSQEFQDLAAGLEVTLDELADEASYESLRDDYRRAMALETAFFSAQPGLPNGRRPVKLLVTDFDDTITDADTTPVIIEEAFSAAEKAAPTPAEGEMIRKDRQAHLEEVLQLISMEKAKLMESIMLPQDTYPLQDFDTTKLQATAEAFSDFDIRMNDAAFASGIIQGLSPGAVMEAGRAVSLKEGAFSTLEMASRSGVPLHVISVSWEGNIIRGALAELGDSISVHANSLQLSTPDGREAAVCTGRTTQEIQCAADKNSVLSKLLAASGSIEGKGQSIFIGDSATDLLAMLQADIGIIIGNNSTLRAVADAVGVSIKPLIEAAASVNGSLSTGTLYQAENWWEIQAFMFGPSPGAAASSMSANQSVDSVPQVPRTLTIAGSDSGGGAGIQADLKTFLAQGTFGMSAITALTAQNTQGVQGVLPIDPNFVSQQLDSVIGDIGVDAIKTGMLPNPEIIQVVAAAIRKHDVQHVVVDPVLVSTSGASLASSAAAKAIISEFLPLATVVTPNLAEVSALLGGRTVETLQDMKEAAKDLHALGPKMVLVKGGHLEGEPEAVDVLFDGFEIHEIRARFVETENLHGTGCTLAAAIAAELAKGHSQLQAVQNAKFYLTEALRSSASLSIGTGMQKPFNHGYRIADWTASRLQPTIDYRLYAVTDPGCNAKTGQSMVEAVRAAIQGGATIIQLREKDTNGGDFCSLARRVLEVARPAGVPVLINDRIDVAVAAGADGVHIGQSDISMVDARRILGSEAVIGVSVATVQQALKAQADGADYVGAGAVYPTTTKGDAKDLGDGLQTLEDICKAVRIPVVGIGGITAQNAQPVICSGAAGVAVVSAIFAAEDTTAATKQLLKVIVDASSSQQQI